jgi:hypothetical protein
VWWDFTPPWEVLGKVGVKGVGFIWVGMAGNDGEEVIHCKKRKI